MELVRQAFEYHADEQEDDGSVSLVSADSDSQ
jgi:hypothetical protein